MSGAEILAWSWFGVQVLFLGVSAAIGAGLWAAIIFGLGMAYRNWRLYGTGRLAKWLRRRDFMRREQGRAVRDAEKRAVNGQNRDGSKWRIDGGWVR